MIVGVGPRVAAAILVLAAGIPGPPSLVATAYGAATDSGGAFCPGPTSNGGPDRSRAEVGNLAERARQGDAQAESDLRGTGSVDGRAVDLNGALGNSQGAEKDSRLRSLEGSSAGGGAGVDNGAGGRGGASALGGGPGGIDKGDGGGTGDGGTGSGGLGGNSGNAGGGIDGGQGSQGGQTQQTVTPDEARKQAEDAVKPPKSSKGGLGNLILLVLSVLVAVLVGLGVSRWFAARQARRKVEDDEDDVVDPVEVERRAQAAEAEEDHEAALRLHFKAGLIRLGDAGLLTYKSSLRSGQAARQLRSTAFDAMVVVFDDVVYGRRPAVPADVRQIREGFAGLLSAHLSTAGAPGGGGVE